MSIRPLGLVSNNVFVLLDYITYLGPAGCGTNKRYEYFVATDKIDKSEFIVRTRDVTRFEREFEDHVLGWLDRNGYENATAVPHPASCQYAA